MLVLVTVATMLVPVYLSGYRAMLRAHRDALASLADALSQVRIETLDSVAASPGRTTPASVGAHRVIRQHLPTLGQNDGAPSAQYVLVTRTGYRLLIRSDDSLQRGLDAPWTAPRGLDDSLANIIAGRRSVYSFREGDTVTVVAPVFRNETIPSALAVTRENVATHAHTLLADFIRLLWIPAVVLALAIALSIYGASRLSRRLRRLADEARSATGGPVPAFTEGEASDDEIGVLRQALVRMSSDLRAHMVKAEHAARMEAVGRLSASVAHDFNNVLTVIGGSADLGMLALAEGGSPLPDLGEIRRAADRGAALTRQLLMFSGRRGADVKVIAVDDVVRALEPMLRRLLGASHELGAMTNAAGAAVLADPTRLEQALLNLVINARDAMPNGGTVLIAARRATEQEVSEAKLADGRYVAITVSDTGHGIDPAISKRIFEPFFSTKEIGKGTGLGLATAMAVATEAGGGMYVHSTLGHGATFGIVLPETTATRTGELPVPVPRPTRVRESRTILLVEDELAVRAMAARVLAAYGYTVIDVRHGLDALIALEQRAFDVDLVLSDVLMPGMTGDELARQVRSSHPEIPIVLMSGYPGSHAGLGDVLLKPFTAEELLARVRAALDQATVAAD